jgi:hypothetical protein
MPLSSIQHEWLLVPLAHEPLSVTGARPDCVRYVLTTPSQSLASIPAALTMVGAAEVPTIANAVTVAETARATRRARFRGG